MTIYETNSPEETFALGRRIGQQARAGEVYTLIGDLGVGKTVLTQGVAAGLGIEEPVNSPTFTIMQIYEEGRLPFIILTCTASVMWKRWTRSVTRIISTETVSA